MLSRVFPLFATATLREGEGNFRARSREPSSQKETEKKKKRREKKPLPLISRQVLTVHFTPKPPTCANLEEVARNEPERLQLEPEIQSARILTIGR